MPFQEDEADGLHQTLPVRQQGRSPSSDESPVGRHTISFAAGKHHIGNPSPPYNDYKFKETFMMRRVPNIFYN